MDKTFIEVNSKPNEKLKAWYLFTDSFVSGTSHLSNLEVGIYIRLLCWNWNKRCCGIPCDSMTQHRIANCISEEEKKSCESVIKEFFIKINDHYQNERQLQEYLYITNRIEASRQNGKLGGRPKKPSPKPSEKPPTHTYTHTSISTKLKKVYFNTFWNKVRNKVSKGTAEKNYLKLDEKWVSKPEDLAILYNNYYESTQDKQFAKQPAFWLSAKKYEDEKPQFNENKIDQYTFYLKKFKEVIESKQERTATSKIARDNIHLVKKAINENQITKEDAEKYLDMSSWL